MVGRTVNRHVITALLLSVLFVAVVPAVRGATPIAPAAFPLIPQPELCLTEPVSDYSIELARGRAGTPVPELDTSTATRLVTGPVLADVTGVLIEVFACFNAGDLARTWALYSPDYLARILPGGLAMMATPVPLDVDEYSEILAIEDVRWLGDERIVATVRLNPALIPVDKIFGFVLVRAGDRWVVDDVLDELRFSLP